MAQGPLGPTIAALLQGGILPDQRPSAPSGTALGGQEQNMLQALLGAAPQVPVPEALPQQSPVQAGLQGLLSMFNPRLAAQQQQQRGAQQLQRQAQIQRAQSENIRLRAQREGQQLNASFRQRELDRLDKQAEFSRTIQEGQQRIEQLLAESLVETRNFQNALTEARTNRLNLGFSPEESRQSDALSNDVESNLRKAWLGETPSGRRKATIGSQMFDRWKRAGGFSPDPAARERGLNDALDLLDQAITESEQRVAQPGIIQETDGISLREAVSAMKINAVKEFNRLKEREEAKLRFSESNLRVPEVHKRIRFFAADE
jgi:hypothetical protein